MKRLQVGIRDVKIIFSGLEVGMSKSTSFKIIGYDSFFNRFLFLEKYSTECWVFGK